MAIFYVVNPTGILVGVRTIKPPDKRLPGKRTTIVDPNSPVMPTGGCAFYDVLNTRFDVGPTGNSWEYLP